MWQMFREHMIFSNPMGFWGTQFSNPSGKERVFLILKVPGHENLDTKLPTKLMIFPLNPLVISH